MIDYYKRTATDKKMRVLKKFEPNCWINVTNPSKGEIEYLVDKFKLDEESLLCGLNKNEIPWASFHDKKTYIMLSTISRIKEHELETLLLIVGKNYMLTLTKIQPDIVKTILDNEIKFITTENREAITNMLSKINVEFEKSIMDIEKDVNMMGKLTATLKEKDVMTLLKYEDRLNKFYSSYNHNIIVFNKLDRKARVSKKQREMLEVVIVEYNEGFEMCKNSLKTISNIRNYYSILLSNKLNRIMTVFTVFTIILGISSAVSDIFGMNIIFPLQNHPSAFIYVILITVSLWVLFLLYFRKNRMF